MKKILSLALVFALILPASGCQKQNSFYSGEFLGVFDTVTQVVGYADSQESFTKLSTFLHDRLQVYHQLYDIYDNFEGLSNVKTINDNAGKAPVKVDKKIIDLLLSAKEKYTLTKGKCNIALGSVLSIWHDYREAGINDPDNAKLPPMADLLAAAKHTDINNIVIDEQASTVYLTDPLMSIDVGAVAKGYATEQVCREAEAAGYTSFLLSVGGNIRAVGSKDGKGLPWSVGVRDPNSDNPSDSLVVTKLTDMALVTSGIYERYYTVDNVDYHHIIDPATLMPDHYYKSVTILCGDSGFADGLTTAVFCMPPDEGMAFISSLSGVEAMWVMNDDSIRYSAHFQDYITK